MKCIKRSIGIICALIMCTGCGQTEPPAATSPTAMTTAGTTAASQKEETSAAQETEVKAPGTTASETEVTPEETTMIVAIETTGKAETAGEETPETETTEAEEKVEIADELDLTVPIDSTLLDQVPDEAIIAQAVLNYYGYSCDVETVSKYCDGASDKEEKFTKCISGYTSAQGITDIEVIKRSKDDMNAEKVFEELNKNNLVVFWSFKRDECTILKGYTPAPGRYFSYDVAYSENGGYECESFDERLPNSEHSIYIISKK